MNEVTVITAAEANNFETSPILLIFSSLSFSLKPKSLFNPKRTLSPSNLYADLRKCKRCCSNAVAIVL